MTRPSSYFSRLRRGKIIRPPRTLKEKLTPRRGTISASDEVKALGRAIPSLHGRQREPAAEF